MFWRFNNFTTPSCPALTASASGVRPISSGMLGLISSRASRSWTTPKWPLSAAHASGVRLLLSAIMVLALSWLSNCSSGTEGRQRAGKEKTKDWQAQSLEGRQAIDAFEEIENHPVEGFGIAGGWSNRLPLAKVDEGKGDGGLVVDRRASTARRLPLRASWEETRNECGRKTEVFAIRWVGWWWLSYRATRTQLRLNTVCGSHSHSGLSITHTLETTTSN